MIKQFLLDVKVGSGAYENIEDARELAKAMVDLGEENGRSVKAIFPADMDRPLQAMLLEIRWRSARLLIR